MFLTLFGGDEYLLSKFKNFSALLSYYQKNSYSKIQEPTPIHTELFCTVYFHDLMPKNSDWHEKVNKLTLSVFIIYIDTKWH